MKLPVALLAGALFLVAITLPNFRAHSADPTALGQAAASLAPGSWTELVTNGFGGGAILDAPVNGHINEYADKAVWNPITREALFFGGAHCGSGNCPGVEKFIRYADDTNSWSAIADHPDDTAHAYQHNTIDPGNGDLYYRSFNSFRIDRRRNGVWSALPSIPGSSKQVAGAIEVFPGRDGLLFVDGDWGVFWFSFAANSWTLLAETNGKQGTALPKLPMGPYHNVAVFSPVHKLILFGGGNGSPTLYALAEDGSIRTETTAPTSVAVNSTIFTVDPVSGDYLLFSNDRRFWTYRPATKSWSELPVSQRPPFFNTASDGPAQGTVAFPISTYGVVLFTTWGGPTGSKVYLYRHAPGSGVSIPTATPAPGATASPTRAPASPRDVFLPVVRRDGVATPTPSAVPSATPGPTGSGFGVRCADPAVVRCYGFDDAVTLAPRMLAPWGGAGKCAGNQCWQVDSAIRSSGGGSLRFEIPSNSGADTSGSFRLNFSDDLTTQFGAGQQFFVQWRQRFSPEFLTTDYDGGGGWKQIIIGTGDQPSKPFSSCSDLEVVLVNGYHAGFPRMYNSCSGSASHGPYDPFEERYGAYDFKLQNARSSPFCLYSQGKTTPSTFFPPTGNCFGYAANEWLTFQVGIELGPRVGDEFVNSRVRLWMAREGKPSEPVFDWGPYNLTAGPAAENQRFGQVWLLPYNTGKSSAQTHPTAYTWYDDLIISRNRIGEE